MSNIKVVGITDQLFCYVASQTDRFKINQILKIVDLKCLDSVFVEVMETKSFNKYIPMATEKTNFIDASVLESLKQVGYSIDENETHIAKVRCLTEQSYPITTGSNVEVPTFNEVESMLIRTIQGWNIGSLKGTEEVGASMPDNLKNLSMLYIPKKGLVPLEGVPLFFDYKSMSEYPHIGIFGGSGSGKSYFVRVCCEEIMAKRIPGIVFDPHSEMEFNKHMPKMPEYLLRDYNNKYQICYVGQDVGVNFLEITPSELNSILKTSSQSFTEGMENTVRNVHSKGDTYEIFISKLNVLEEYLNKFEELQEKYESRNGMPDKERTKIQFTYEVVSKYRTKGLNTASIKAVLSRMYALERKNIFKGDAMPVIDGLKNQKLMVLRGSIDTLKIVSAYLLGKVYGLRRQYKEEHTDFFPPFVVITDEAHNFAPKGVECASKPIIKEIAQEGRKYGSFLFLATQRPALLDDTIIAQLNTKFIFRTVRGQDIKLLADETDLSQQDMDRLPYLTSGDCFISSAVLGRTMAVRVRAAHTVAPHSQNPFDELEELNDKDDRLVYLIESLPIQQIKLKDTLFAMEKALGSNYPLSHAVSLLDDLVSQGKISKSGNGLFATWSPMS